MQQNYNNKILTVDDDPTNLKILRIHLEDKCELKQADSGTQALELVNTFRPAVVLLDIMMPNMSGYEVLKKIRSDKNNFYVKIIFLSSKSMLEDRLEGYSYEVDDYITKPFNGNELIAKLKVYLKLYNIENELAYINANLTDQVEIRTEQLLNAERLAYIGRHACDIVHNLKNPVLIVQHHIDRISTQYPENVSVRKVISATNRITAIINDILNSTNEDKLKITLIDINSIIKEEIEILNLNGDFKSKIHKNLILKNTTKIMANPIHLHQIIGNIIKNANEAMSQQTNGELEVTTEDFDNYCLITITDNGPGIAPENLEKIFQLNFTTKSDKNGEPVGHGIGLSYCKKMIESYGGKILIISNNIRGVRVTIKLPFGTKKTLITSEVIKKTS